MPYVLYGKSERPAERGETVSEVRREYTETLRENREEQNERYIGGTNSTRYISGRNVQILF